MSSNFVIETPTVDDAARLALIDETAYDSNPMRNSLSAYQSATREQQVEHLAWSTLGLRKRLEHDLSGIFFKAVDKSTGSIAGWMELKKPGFEGPQSSSKDATTQEERVEIDDSQMPKPLWRMDKVERFVQMWEVARKRAMGDRDDYWCLAKLVVDPQYQRQGVGRMLLSKGLEAVDSSGLAIYTGSTPDGERLARECNFKALDVARCEGIESHLTIMFREGRK